MPKFKVGDRVRMKSGPGFTMIVVKAPEFPYDDYCTVVPESGPDCRTGAFVSDLEKAKEPKIPSYQEDIQAHSVTVQKVQDDIQTLVDNVAIGNKVMDDLRKRVASLERGQAAGNRYTNSLKVRCDSLYESLVQLQARLKPGGMTAVESNAEIENLKAQVEGAVRQSDFLMHRGSILVDREQNRKRFIELDRRLAQVESCCGVDSDDA